VSVAPRTLPGPLLALDTGSRWVSMAVALAGEVLAERRVEIARSSEALLVLADEALRGLGLAPRDLRGVVALRGPGSFTGLRVGLATALGLHQALGLPAAALPTLQVLAAAVPAAAGRRFAAVNALRGEWFVQEWSADDPPRPLEEPALRADGDLAQLGRGLFVGFGLGRAAGRLAPGTAVLEPGPLAGVAGRLASRHPLDWDAAALSAPLYLRAPAVTAP
jgi:tRNA threonylcarbamoyl adenosine modification protein YeaZ